MRTLAVVAIALLLTFEVRAIYRDDEKRTSDWNGLLDKTNAIITNNDSATNKIITSANVQFSQAGAQLASIGSLVDKNLRASNDTLSNITGGKSVLYVEPMTSLDGSTTDLVLWNGGPYTLTSTMATIRPLSAPRGPYMQATAGALVAKQYSDFVTGVDKVPAQAFPGGGYWIVLSAQNGVESEIIEFRNSDTGVLQYKLNVYRLALPTPLILSPQDAKAHGHLVYQKGWTNVARKPR
jgi:hypothetical protein